MIFENIEIPIPPHPIIYIEQMLTKQSKLLHKIVHSTARHLSCLNMASSSVNQNSLHYFRSNSLPTRANPLISEFSDHLSRLRCSEATSSSSTSLSQKLIGIQDLHDCVDKLLLLPCTQALAQEQHEKWYPWMCAVLQGMHCRNQRNAHVNFNQPCAEEGAVKLTQ